MAEYLLIGLGVTFALYTRKVSRNWVVTPVLSGLIWPFALVILTRQAWSQRPALNKSDHQGAHSG